MDKEERKEYLKKISAYSCPIPQYEETRKKVMDWNRKNGKEQK